MNATLRGWGGWGGSLLGFPSSSVPVAAGAAVGAAVQGQPGSLIPIITGVTTAIDVLEDPYRRVAILEAQLRDALTRGRSAYEVDLIRGKLEAAKIALSTEESASRSLQDWRTLGKIGLGTGIAIGAAILLWILTKTIKSARGR